MDASPPPAPHARDTAPTLRQVAALAGVSIKTASRALRGEANVAASTANRVQQSARSIGFRVNAIASELRRGAPSTLIGLLTADIGNPFYSRVASGVERVLRPLGLQLITASTGEDPITERSLVEALLQRRVQALLITSSDTDHRHFADDVGRGMPLVFIDRPPIDVEADAVVIDNAAGAETAVKHLLAQGHRRIGVVADLSRLATARDRLAGVNTAMTEAGIDDWHTLSRQDAHSIEAAENAVTELLARPQAPTAFVTLNNRITAGALRALTKVYGAQGIPQAQWPALIGFDDFELSDVLGISVIGYDTEELGRAAAGLAVDRAGRGPRTVVVPTQLITRGSGERRPPA